MSNLGRAGSEDVDLRAEVGFAGGMTEQRYRDEIGAGVKTGLIRAMGSSGGVVFTAAFVFAFTMLALLSSDVVNIGQAGSTICMGLILDMLVVRLLLVMPLARLMGPWFWWPQRIPSRPRD